MIQLGVRNVPPSTIADNSESDQETKKPLKTLGFQGFSEVGDTELESVTSTMSTFEHNDSDRTKQGVKLDDYEPLHQMLHQISKLVEHGRLETLAEVLADSLEPDALERLADAISRRVAKG